MTVYKSVSELIGGTPLVELTNYEKNNDLDAIIVGKVESFNPAGSVKDLSLIHISEPTRPY